MPSNLSPTLGLEDRTAEEQQAQPFTAVLGAWILLPPLSCPRNAAAYRRARLVDL